MFLKNILFAITILFAMPSFAITVNDIKKLHETYSEGNSILLQKFEEIEPQIQALPLKEQEELYEEFFVKIMPNEKIYEHYKNYPLKDDIKSQYINYFISYFFNDTEKLELSLKHIEKYKILDLKTNDLKILYIIFKSLIRNKQGAYYESLIILDEAEKFIQEIKYIDTKISFLNHKAIIYYYLKDYQNSNVENKKIIELYEEHNKPVDLSYLYILNNIYYNLPNDQNNRDYLIEKLDYIIQTNKDKNILALSYFISGLIASHYKEPLEYYNKSIQLYNELNIQEEVYYTKLIKGKYLADSNNASDFYTEELKKILDDVFQENSENKKVFRLKSAYYKRINDYENSLKYLEIYKEKYNQEFSKKFTTTVEDLKVMFDIVNKEENNLNLVQSKSSKENKIKTELEIALEKNKQLFYSFLIFCILVLIIFTFVYFYKKMREEATIDDLTKLYNRKTIMSLGEHAFSVYDRTFSLILFDIDYFKKINDQYGHEIGDKVLYEFSQLIKQNLRKTDHLGRYGGEEFLIVTPSNIHAAYEMAERLRTIVSNYQFECADIKITSSFGVVCQDEHNTFDHMLKDADHMLYLAKHNGRNNVVKKETL